MSGRKSIVLAAAGLVVAGGVMTAPSAAAATTPKAAESPLLMWEDPNMGGSLYVTAFPDNCPNGCDIDGWDGDNEISSVSNPTACKVRLYDLDGFGGSTVDIRSGQYVGNLESLGFDNKAESFKFIC